jgi:PUA domain protein
MNRHLLSTKESKEFISRIKAIYGIEIKGNIELGKEKKQKYYFVNGVLSFIGDELIPSLCSVLKLKIELPYVVVDEGAVKAIINGADLFVPGIIEFKCECKNGDIILVKTKTGHPVAVMRVLMSKNDAESLRKGKFAENLHYVGDEIWKLCMGK